MSRTSIKAWPLAAVVFLAGCGADPYLTVTPTTVSPGGTVTYTLHNPLLFDTLGYNLCSVALERESAEGWTRVADAYACPPPTGGGCYCTKIQLGLRPRETTSYTRQLSADLEPGHYRAVTNIELRSETIIVSGDLDVE